MRTDQLEYARSLLDVPPYGGTGARLLSPDPRDYDLRSAPDVAAQLAAGVPAAADLLRYLGGDPDNQGATPACVAASTCNLGSMDDIATGGRWEQFDWLGLYREAGGDGSNGVDTRRVLDIAVTSGLPLSSGRRKLIASYAFVPQVPGTFRDTIKASIAAGQPVTLALLLPAPFGWASGMAATTAYHQVVAIGYDETWVWVFNSWGPGWPGEAGSPKPGVGRVRWDFLEADSLQRDYCYAYGTQSVPIPNPQPIPTPTPTPTPSPTPGPVVYQVTGRASGTGVVARGDTLTLSGAFQGNLQVDTAAPAPLPAPTPTPTPTPTPSPIPTPTPTPGSLKVSLYLRRYSANLIGIWAYAQEPGSADLAGADPTAMFGAGYVAASVRAAVQGGGSLINLEMRMCQANGIPAVWQTQAPGAPATVTVVALDGQGRTGTAQGSI